MWAVCLIACIIKGFAVYSTYMAQTPPIPGQTSLIPVNNCVLVKLDRTDRKESKYDTRTSGICIADSSPVDNSGNYLGEGVMPETLHNYLVNKRVYFEEYKEGARIKRGGELFCFIKIEDIRGYEDV